MSDAGVAADIADDLARRIVEGEWQPGDRFPSRRVLLAEYDTNTSTLDRVIIRLTNAGLILPRRGRAGTIVAERQPARSNRFQRFAEDAGDLRGHFADWPGRNTTVDVELIEPVDLHDDLADHVGEPRALLRQRRYLVDGEVTQTATSWVPLTVAEGIERLWVADTGPAGMYGRFRDAGYGPLRIREEIVADPMTEVEAVRFDVPRHVRPPVFHVWRTVGDQGGKVLEVAEILMRADRYQLAYGGVLPIPD